jgi:hypothetical protein
MSGLGGFLFGNIDEEGRLDDEDLDEVNWTRSEKEPVALTV